MLKFYYLLGQKRKFEFFVIFIVLCCSSVAKVTGIPHTADSQQPKLMLVPLKNFVDFMSVGIEGGNAELFIRAHDMELESLDLVSLPRGGRLAQSSFPIKA